LGWETGQGLALDATDSMIVITPGPGNRHRVDDRGALPLPAAARRMCGLTSGSPVILVAAVHEQILFVQPAAIVARLLAAQYAKLIGTRNAR